MAEITPIHRTLDCGIELAVVPLPGRHTVAAELRFLVGFVHEPEDKLGLNYVLEETIAKATAHRSGRELSDAFDAMGARWTSWAGREATGYSFTCLPEYFDKTLALHGEYLCEPHFTDRDVDITVRLTIDEMAALEDDAQDLAGVLFNRQVYGPTLGRHVLGGRETVAGITCDDVKRFWKAHYNTGGMQVAVAGPVDPDEVAAGLERAFGGLGSSTWSGRAAVPWTFEPQCSHHDKDVEQQQIGICYLGATLDDDRRHAQKAAMAVLSGGMSSRLFTELRERQGLVYWVTAWTEHPRGVGIVYLGASTKPGRAEQTYFTLLDQVDRLAGDLEENELRRSIDGLVAKVHTRGDATRAWCSEVADSIFHYGRILARAERIERLQAVTLGDVQTYLTEFPRNDLSVLTLGPKQMDYTAKPVAGNGV